MNGFNEKKVPSNNNPLNQGEDNYAMNCLNNNQTNTRAYAYDYSEQIDLGSLTAKQVACLLLEGVNVYAPNKMWKRIRKHLSKMGVSRNIDVDFSIIDFVTALEIDAWIGYWLDVHEYEVQAKIDAFIEEVNLSMEEEVEEFLEDMYLMGFLDGPDSEEESG